MSDFLFYTVVATLLIIGYVSEGIADSTKWPALLMSMLLVVGLYVACLLIWWFGARKNRGNR